MTTKKTVTKSTARKKLAAPVIRRRAVSMATLDNLGACEMQRNLFMRVFGTMRTEKVEISPENVRRAWEARLFMDWLIYRVLNKKWTAIYLSRRRQISGRFQNMEINEDQKYQAVSELISKMLRAHWGEK